MDRMGWWQTLLAEFVMVVLAVTPGRASAPDGATTPDASQVYAKKSTWQETMLVSREALMRRERAAGKGRPLPNFGASDYTVTAWIRTTVGGTIFSMSSAEGVWAQRGGKVFFVRGGKLGFDAAYIRVLVGRTVVADGKWHHVAITFQASKKQLTFYVDGKPDGGGQVAAEPDVSGHIVRVGLAARNFWAPNGFKGDIDDVRIYDKVLSPPEIKARYETPPPSSDAACVAHWRLDRNATDASGNGHHGTFHGAAIADGKIGKAFRFNGQSSVEVAVGTGLHVRRTLWKLIERDFMDHASRRQIAWERSDPIWDADWEPGAPAGRAALAGRYAVACRRIPALAARAQKQASGVRDAAGLAAIREVYSLSRRIDQTRSELRSVNLDALRLAIDDLIKTFGGRYPKGREYLARMDACKTGMPELVKRLTAGDRGALETAEKLISLADEALLANPLLDFDRLLLIKRGEKRLGLSQNWQSNSSLPRAGYDNEIAVLSPVRRDGKLTTLFRPEGNGGKFVGDVDLHFDADRMLFSMPGKTGRWQVFEIRADGGGLRQLPLIEEPDVDNYDACYLPDGNIIFCSTAPFVGVPCVTGSSHVCHLYLLSTVSGDIRRLTFEQDHDWCPTVLNDGRVLYLRWEYSDIPHFASRILFHMKPDGTAQMEYYGSNSYWPNATFYARPVPNHPTKFVGIVGGHHDVPRMGELVVFDPAKGRHEADGVVQRVPGYGKKVEPIIRDTLVNASWPRFLHPYPLSDKYFVVSCQPSPGALWGIYLVDVFDNMLLLKEVPGYVLFEPVPLHKTPTPPIIPDKVKPERQDATVYLSDVYYGDGLKGVPRGTVKKLRVYEFHYCYPKMGGHIHVGIEGTWDVHRIVGTVPVFEDGSAVFKVPANTPLAVQPLDAEGKAVQVMRSWFVAMPGEVLSCVGCHERQNAAPPPRKTVAATHRPFEIEPWYGPTRGFSFKREVQPVLDKYCVGCHSGQKRPDGKCTPDFRAKDRNGWSNFTPSYLALHPYVRRPGPESDYHLLNPMEFHVNTSELMQMMAKGHHGVRLDAEALDRFITWIDLNVPDHGTWHEHRKIPANYHERRLAMRTRYANRPEDPEVIPAIKRPPVTVVKPQPVVKRGPKKVDCPGWPFDAAEATKRQTAAGPKTRQTLDLGDGVKMDLVLIPSGEFVMGSLKGPCDLTPLTRVKIRSPFWMGVLEVTNRQFHAFDPSHDNGYFDQHHKDHTTPGYSAHGPDQPVIRVSWTQAMAFCRWLSDKTGRQFTLPTEAQWEWACRAGTATPLNYGDLDTDFSAHANLADFSIRLLAVSGVNPSPIANPNPYQDFLPKDGRFNDKSKLMSDVGKYRPNAWGLHDMHGNVWEWTRTSFEPYPYREDDGRNDLAQDAEKVVRGGSWYDRPKRARSGFRLAYRPYQRVFNVGIRVVCVTR